MVSNEDIRRVAVSLSKDVKTGLIRTPLFGINTGLTLVSNTASLFFSVLEPDFCETGTQ